MLTELDVYAPERWVDDALFRPEVRDAYRRLAEQGWTDALRALHPGERVYTFWKYFRNAFARDAGLRIDHLLLSLSLVGRLVASSAGLTPPGFFTLSKKEGTPASFRLNTTKVACNLSFRVKRLAI